jgi:hypothetical protein
MARKLTDRQYQMIMDEVADGMSSKSSIAKRNGISLGHLNDILNGDRCESITGIKQVGHDNMAGGPCRWKGGEAISDNDVRDIVRRHRKGERIPDIHKDYPHVISTYISDIALRKRRKNVIV